MSDASHAGLRAVALGGGHGLHATLSALRTITTDVTAVVTVADDGGSSGRIRRELGLLPPGDLRMALSALAGHNPPDILWAQLMQHRFGGTGALAGHPVGNLLLAGLMERFGDPVLALAEAGRLVGAVGRVLPMSPVPLDLVAEVDRIDDDPEHRRTIRGQASIATTVGRVRNVRVLPAGAPACANAVDAVREADVVVLGPGSWFSSVIPHLLVRELAHALVTTRAAVVVVLNLVPQTGETDGFSPTELVTALLEHAPGLRIHAVVADTATVDDSGQLQDLARAAGASLVLSTLATDNDVAVHDPVLLARALVEAFGGEAEGESHTWR